MMIYVLHRLPQLNLRTAILNQRLSFDSRSVLSSASGVKSGVVYDIAIGRCAKITLYTFAGVGLLVFLLMIVGIVLLVNDLSLSTREQDIRDEGLYSLESTIE